ncbi:translation initiation factor IF-1, putative [Plasmodium gallinaceum]|uniref:Translation initiation factor IF-1, putative n=1 Tax=Plasmodium gallinaceum TaxID=5849 RepID=A0A1J1GQU8_PLAGA|nr:translation initiation factor IF-1, putative [Plasmodium gallinaceum]CRG94887.1 translation initiation factor IF-1, putative [Plasmodium gallinaceum]
MFDKISFFFFFFCYVYFLYLTNELSLKRSCFINPNNKIDIWKKTISEIYKKSTLNEKKKIIQNLKRRHNNLKNNILRGKENDVIEMNGTVEECLANTNFIVKISNGEKFLCFISGKLRINKVKINLGDLVKIQVHKLDFEKRRGRIIFRYLQQATLKKKK